MQTSFSNPLRRAASWLFGFDVEISILQRRFEDADSRAVSLFEETERWAKRNRVLSDKLMQTEDQRNAEYKRAEDSAKVVAELTEKTLNQAQDLTKKNNTIIAYKGQITKLKAKIASLENKVATYEVEQQEG